MSFGCRKAFIPELDWKVGLRAEQLHEGLRFFRGRTQRTGEIERIADEDGAAAFFAEEPEQRLGITAIVAHASVSEQRLRGVAEGVRDGDADAGVANVQGGLCGLLD